MPTTEFKLDEVEKVLGTDADATKKICDDVKEGISKKFSK